MMGRWGARESLMLTGAVLLSLSIAYCSGKKQGARDTGIQATRDSLSVVVKQSKAIQSKRDSLSLELKVEAKRSATTRTVYVRDSAKVSLHGDTAITADSSQVLLPEVADRLRAADAHIASLEAENRTLRFALGNDSTLIANQAEQIRLNQNIAKMIQGPKCGRKCGIVIGVSATIGAAYVANLLRK